ncbi:hypothetical protein B9Z55_006997 [Caenorhabditis nigoni]|uniref:F-box associated domain-containing protein n=1 Tax=Caenorhabditis nigoni TaxID=1611254 RepID=A0A2G5V8B7_9PELO|nr:hypothetical protein B9Z55_006997 [Caenorhabditis nigoni]
MLKINDHTYGIDFDRSQTGTWQYSDRMSNPPLILQVWNSNFYAQKYFLKNYGVEVATRKFFKYLLGGRSIIRVKLLEVSDGGYENMQYLFGLSNMKVSALQSWDIDLAKLHQLVESPLKELRFRVSDPSDFENPIARTAETILILHYGYNDPDIWLETHRNLPNKEVVVDTIIPGLTDISIMELIEYWSGNRKAVGSSFSVLKPHGYPIEMFLRKAKERFQGTYVKLKETAESKVTKINVVSIDVDSESKIFVYGGKSEYGPQLVPKIVIEMMPVGSSEEISEP